MTDSKLADILTQALKEGLHVRDDLYLFDTKLAWKLTNEAHVHKPQRIAVFTALEADPQIQPILGMYLNSGLNGKKLTKELLGDWLLTRATQLGPEGAVAELRAFVDNGYLDLEEYVAFSGLEVSAPVTLPDGIDLVPMREIPESVLSISLTDPEWFYFGRNEKGHVVRKSTQVLAAFGKNTFHADPHVAMAALRTRYRRKPALLSTPVDFPNSQDMMVDAIHVLAAATSTATFPIAHWISPNAATPFWKEFGWRHWYHLNALREFTAVEGKEKQIASAMNCWSALTDQMKKNLHIPLERLNRALAAPSAIDCAIDLGLALEALLLSGLGSNDQISLAFRLRGAWLLGKDSAERRSLVQKFNAIYKCRSAAVHRGDLPSEKLAIDGENVPAFDFITNSARRIAATAVLNVIERGSFPDWGMLLVGDEGEG